MSEHVISVALLTIASVTCIGVLVHAAFPLITEMSVASSSRANIIEERMETNIKIINAINQSDTMIIWVKNTGTNRIVDYQITSMDVFFGPEYGYERVPYNNIRAITPSWNYTIENDDDNGQWNSHETIKITIKSDSISQGDYYINIITYNGISDYDYFSL